MVITAENGQVVVEFLAFAESRFAVGAEYSGIPNRSLSPTGEPYTVLSDGLFPELSQACEKARALFEAYAAGRTGLLYWRVRPEFEETKKGWERGWKFYMRLLISDKAVIDNG